jgi:RepB DNA-primase from phage plasmid
MQVCNLKILRKVQSLRRTVYLSTNTPLGRKYMESKNKKILEKVIEALGAQAYIVRLIHTDNLNGIVNPHSKVIHGVYTSEALLKSAQYFAWKNTQGYNIYFRPNGYEYVLLDDIQKEELQTLSALKPCLLIETSPNNFQVWLKLKQVPTDREHAKEICRYLAEKFHADKGSAEPDHIGRLPSYTNRKAKYKQENGNYPYVILHKSENRYADFFLPKGEFVLKIGKKIIKSKETNKPTTDHDRSRYDFNNVCMWLRQGKTYNQIYDLLKDTSEKVKDREGRNKENYLHGTIQNAIKATGIIPKT